MAALTATYLNPATTPTATTGQNQNTVVVTLTPAATADTALITTAFGLSTTELAAGWPNVSIEPLNDSAQGANWSLTSSDANFVFLTKNNSTASSSTTPQIRVKVARPHSYVR